MKHIFAVILILFSSCMWMTAQEKIMLNSPNRQLVETHLYDEEDNFLLTLPLTFSITDKNVLIMMAGNDLRLTGEQTVWMFSEEINLSDLLKNNHNVSVSKILKQQNTKFHTVLMPNRNITLRREFDDGYEIIKKNAKPVFFNISNPSSDSQTFYLQFYVAKSDGKYPYIFISKCKPIEIELIIK